GKPDQFVPQLRELGATLVRVYFFWSQVEPEHGRFSFEAVDAFLEQLDGSEEVWVTVCSSSRWATEQATDFLPPSPARDPDAYHRFVRRLVGHCGGRGGFWACGKGPPNVGPARGRRAGARLAVEHRALQRRADLGRDRGRLPRPAPGVPRAVNDADPGAAVVLG